jgi:predicted O-methyltransferase YrrM
VLGTDVEVWSVDNDAAWLERTRRFLVSRHLSSLHLYGWHEFLDADHGHFDIVLNDFGHMGVRAEVLGETLGLVRPGGLVLLDDVHKAGYARLVNATLREAGFRQISLRRYTLDRFGRFSLLAIRPKPQ